MSRATDDASIMTRTARERLHAKHEPYWRGIEGGLALGYRKGTRGGVWLVRMVEDGRYRKETLGRADGAVAADGTTVLEFRQAQVKAREWATRRNRVAAGLEPEPVRGPVKPYTVADAMADYLADYAARGGKSLATTTTSIEAHILPSLGALPVGRLTREKLKAWHRGLAAVPPRLRSKAGQAPRHREASDDPDALRRRRATANRVLTTLRAALNHARKDGKVSCPDDAWSLVEPFREVDQPKVRYLSADEALRLLNACEPDFRELVTGALLTGCRYGELAAMKAGDFDPQAGTVCIGRSKGRKARHIVLTEEGRAFFAAQSAGKAAGALLFTHEVQTRRATRHRERETRRAPWRASQQDRPIKEACEAAKITPPIGFHVLRHTYASRLVMRTAPLPVVAAQLGHADTRMTSRHYAHLAPDYVADTVRTTFGTLGVAPTQPTLTRLRRT